MWPEEGGKYGLLLHAGCRGRAPGRREERSHLHALEHGEGTTELAKRRIPVLRRERHVVGVYGAARLWHGVPAVRGT